MRWIQSLIWCALITSSQVGFAFSDEEFARQVEQINYFSSSPATFATMCRGDQCVSTAAGHTSFDRREPATVDSLVSIGSNSKLITAILTLRMVDQGYLRLDDALTDFYPEYALWKGVTVRHLLQHASGVPPYLFSQDGLRRVALSVFNWHSRIWKPTELVGIVKDQPLIFPPGSRVEYNNTNYVLLGMILDKATHKPLGELLTTEIFAPLGMTNSYLKIPASERPRRVSGYLPMQVPVPAWLFNLVAHKVDKKGDYLDTTRIFDDSFTWAAGGMVSTTGDLAKLLRGLFSGRLVSSGLLNEMKAMRDGTVLGMPFVYGLGLMRLPTSHGDLYGHGGLTPGYQTLSNYLESQDMTLTMSQNLGPAQLYTVYFDLLDLMLKEGAYRDFVPDADVGVDRLPQGALHLRVHGKITDGQPTRSPFPRSFGFVKLKSTKFYSTFQSFGAQHVAALDRTYVSIEGYSGGNIFAGTNAKDTKRAFVKVWIDRNALLSAQPSALTANADDPGAIFAYRGFETVEADGSKHECVYEVIDRTRPVAFQVDGLEGESFDIEQTVKFVGNIPLKKLSLTELPDELAQTSVELCR